MRGLVAALSIVCMLCSAGSAMADKRVAFVVGNGAYKNAPRLVSTASDARAMAAALRGVGFDVVEGIDLTREQMTERLLEFGNKTQGADVAIFYYAGHGIAISGSNYLLPVDADIKSEMDVKLGAAINLDLALDQTMSDAKVKLVFLDACRENPFTEKLSTKALTRGGPAVPSGLAEMKSGEGTLIAFATGPGQTALDGADGARSPFTRALIDHITKPGVEIQQALTEVRAEVNEETNKSQLPWGRTNLIGEVYLNPAPTAPGSGGMAGGAGAGNGSAGAEGSSPSPAANASDVELEFWRSVQGSNKVDELNAYLNAYPNGKFRAQALSRIASLPASDPSPDAEDGNQFTEDTLGLDDAKRRDVQQRLFDAGFDIRIDGRFDAMTRAVISDWQSGRGLPKTGYLNKLQYEALLREVGPAKADNSDPDESIVRMGRGRPIELMDFPEFPSWPPPVPSASYVLPDRLLARYHTLKEATDAIIAALEDTGYVERSFFRTQPGGIALVTQLERIESDGSPAQPGRWATGKGVTPSAKNLIDFLSGLFFVKKGHYRLIVFVIQDTPFVLSAKKKMVEPEARALIAQGANVLPAETGKRTFAGNYCTALIYEFASNGKSVDLIAESPLTGKQHLDKAGVLSLLAKPH